MRRRVSISRTILIVILIAALIMIVYMRLSDYRSGHLRIYNIVPWGLIAVCIISYLINEFERLKKTRRDERSKNMDERKQRVLDSVNKSQNKDSD